MLAATNTTTLPAPSKHETAKKWLQKRLWKPASPQLLRGENTAEVKRKLSLKRPQTAPSQKATPDAVPPVPQIPINIELPSPRLALLPPLRPPRPDSGVIRDINAWLDASTAVPPPLPLMGGVPYWRSTSASPTLSSPRTQYAVPIAREPGSSRPATPSSQQVRSMCRRGAKKVQAKMPSLLRTTSERLINRRSNSMPLLAVAYEQTRQGTPPKLLARNRSFRFTSARTSNSKTATDEQPLLLARQHASELPVPGPSIPCSSYEGHASRRALAASRHPTNTTPSATAAHLSLGDSLGDLSLSEAPTYSSGRAPPSYRSRTASIMTTSSFGCLDGISPAQRHVARQRAAGRSRGVRGRVRELRRRFQGE